MSERLSDRLTSMLEDLLAEKEQIKKEVEDGMKSSAELTGGKPRRKSSETAYQIIHNHYTDLDECLNTDVPCLKAAIKKDLTADNARPVADILAELLPYLHPNEDTRATLFSTINKFYARRFETNSELHKYARSKLALSREQRTARTARATGSRYRKLEHMRTVDEKDIFRVMDLTRRSDRWEDQMIAVGLAVGSRLIEVAALATYTKTDDTHILQTGVADKLSYKDKSEHKVSSDTFTIDKPVVHLTVEETIGLVVTLRAQIQGIYKDLPWESLRENDDARRTVTGRLSGHLKKRIHELFKRDDLTFHSMREIYGQVSHHLYGADEQVLVWVARVLGHKKGDIVTAVNYSSIRTLPPDYKLPGGDLSTGLATKLAELDNEVKRIAPQEIVQQAVDIIKSSNTVWLTDEDGERWPFEKQPHLRDGRVQDRLDDIVETLKNRRIAVTWGKLQQLGFGRGTIASRKRRMAEVEAGSDS